MPKPKYYRLKTSSKDATTVNKVVPKLYSPDEETIKNLKTIDWSYKPLQGNALDYMQMLGGAPTIKSDTTLNRSQYDFNSNTMTFGGNKSKDPLNNYMDELSHAVQNKRGDKIVGKLGEGYDDRGTTENIAHREIEPKLYEAYTSYDNKQKEAFKKLKLRPKYKLK